MSQQQIRSKPPAAGATEAAPAVRKLERTRHKLVAAIRAEIAASGDFTAERVAQRAGISTATFYNHFANKDEALLAAYQSLMEDLAATIAGQCRIEKLLDEGLEQFVADWLLGSAAFFRDNVALFRLAQPAIERSRAMRDVYRHHEDGAIQRYRRLVELGQAARVIREGDALAMAQTLAVITEGWYHPMVQKLEPGSPLHREMTAAMVRVLGPE